VSAKDALFNVDLPQALSLRPIAVSEIKSYVWSPETPSGLLRQVEENGDPSSYLIYSSIRQIVPRDATAGMSSHPPKFTADGKYFFFVSDAISARSPSDTEWNHADIRIF